MQTNSDNFCFEAKRKLKYLEKEKNADIIGCIQVKNTNINFPFVQTTNNKYYLNHSLDKTENSAGWAFLDKTAY